MELSETEWPIDGTAPAFLRRNHTTTAALNRWQALNLLSRSEYISQRQLAKATRLRTSTMSNIVRDLKEMDLIVDSGPLATTRVGPKESGLAINPAAAWAVSLQLNPSSHEVALVNAAGHVMARHCFPPGISWREAVASTPSVVEKLSAIARPAPASRAGIGVSVSGIVDASRGTVLFSRALNMSNHDLRADIEKLELGPVHIERDVNCGACAEHLCGAARQNRTFLFYFIRPGFGEPYQFGLGLILNGRIFHGLCSASGELDRLLAPEFPVEKRTPEGYDEFYRECGVRLSSIINMLDIGRVIMAGYDPQFTEERLERLSRQVNESILPVPGRKVEIERAVLGVSGILQGAGLLVINRHLREQIFESVQGDSLALRK